MDTLNLIASAINIVLASLAIFISIWFFVQSKNTEKETSNSLTKIETQTDMLQKLTGRWMDRLTKYVTSDRTQEPNTSFHQLLNVVTQLQTLPPSITSDEETQTEAFISMYIALYFYCIQTNFWSQLNLPTASNFDEKNESHITTKSIIDTSYDDAIKVKQVVENIPKESLEKNPLNLLFQETQENWVPLLKSSSDIFIADAKKS